MIDVMPLFSFDQSYYVFIYQLSKFKQRFRKSTFDEKLSKVHFDLTNIYLDFRTFQWNNNTNILEQLARKFIAPN
jgi:hypothetical protein